MQRLTSQTFRIYWQHSKRYPWKIFIVLLGILTTLVAELYKPFLYKNFFNLLAQNSTNLYGQLKFVIVLILIANFIAYLGYRVNHFVSNSFEISVMRDLLNTCFEYLQKHSFGYFSNNFSGSLQRKVNRYARSYEDITDLIIWEAVPNLLRVISIIVILSLKYWAIGFALLIWAVIHTAFNYYFTQYKLKFDLKKSKIDTEISGFLSDTITNNLNIKIFSNLNFEVVGYKKLTQKWAEVAAKSWDLEAISQAVQGILMILIEFFAFTYALKFWRMGQFNLGDFVFLQSYVLMTFNNVWNFSRYLKRFYESMADANEMTEILLEKHEVEDKKNAKQLQVKKGSIDFKKVAYSYNTNVTIYDDFNLIIPAGEKIAIIGPSGGGKSTFVKLLLRFYNLDSGKILIDGQDISAVTQDSLRSNIALVPQDPILFHRSIIDNIRYAKIDATDEEVIEAARLAHCHEFITKFPLAYQTFVGERGVKLSGGERQRVAIARAILKNAPILILDEATSSLDSESERLIQDALKNLMHRKTAIVIAHRLSTVMQMDRIVVIENGKVIEEGKHKELLKLSEGTYQKLWNIQAGGFTK
jgi:ATP-binding cassette subfamily B protein